MQRAPASSSEALSLEQRQFAAEQHNLIYAYLNEKGLYHEEYYDIAAFGYLQAVKRYLTQPALRQYAFSTIAWRAMRQSIAAFHRSEERRKAAPGKEGKLGVEGMTPEIILRALRASGAHMEDTLGKTRGNITKQDFMELGLSGGADSSVKRKKLLQKLELPEHMSSNALLQAVNLLYELEDFKRIVEDLE